MVSQFMWYGEMIQINFLYVSGDCGQRGLLYFNKHCLNHDGVLKNSKTCVVMNNKVFYDEVLCVKRQQS